MMQLARFVVVLVTLVASTLGYAHSVGNSTKRKHHRGSTQGTTQGHATDKMNDSLHDFVCVRDGMPFRRGL